MTEESDSNHSVRTLEEDVSLPGRMAPEALSSTGVEA